MNSAQIDELFDRLRKAGHGAVVRFDANNSGQPMEGIILDPGPERPSGFEDGIFVAVPSDPENVYYLDPEASGKKGQLVVKRGPPPWPWKKPASPALPDELLKEFEPIGQAPDVKRGGGATGQACSKHKGIIELD